MKTVCFNLLVGVFSILMHQVGRAQSMIQIGDRPTTRLDYAYELATTTFTGELAERVRDLSLSETQKEKIIEITRTYYRETSNQSSDARLPLESAEDFSRRMNEKWKSHRQHAVDLLGMVFDERQTKLVTALYIQKDGIFSLRDPEISLALGLNDDQNYKISKTLQDLVVTSKKNRLSLGLRAHPKDVETAKLELLKTYEHKMISILTDTQRTAFEKLKEFSQE